MGTGAGPAQALAHPSARMHGRLPACTHLGCDELGVKACAGLVIATSSKALAVVRVCSSPNLPCSVWQLLQGMGATAGVGCPFAASQSIMWSPLSCATSCFCSAESSPNQIKAIVKPKAGTLAMHSHNQACVAAHTHKGPSFVQRIVTPLSSRRPSSCADWVRARKRQPAACQPGAADHLPLPPEPDVWRDLQARCTRRFPQGLLPMLPRHAHLPRHPGSGAGFSLWRWLSHVPAAGSCIVRGGAAVLASPVKPMSGYLPEFKASCCSSSVSPLIHLWCRCAAWAWRLFQVKIPMTTQYLACWRSSTAAVRQAVLSKSSPSLWAKYGSPSSNTKNQWVLSTLWTPQKEGTQGKQRNLAFFAIARLGKAGGARSQKPAKQQASRFAWMRTLALPVCPGLLTASPDLLSRLLPWTESRPTAASPRAAEQQAGISPTFDDKVQWTLPTPSHHTRLCMAWQQTLLRAYVKTAGGQEGGRGQSAPVDAHASFRPLPREVPLYRGGVSLHCRCHAGTLAE